ncbi:hypothetical protein D4R87_01570 [bacterium]|nr:MAG: hypothetical protein D4R87_01570 [bacterium]
MRLSRFESIYSLKKAIEIRMYFHDKNVIVVDLDGVLAGGEERTPNERGINALELLYNAGYSFVLWTRGSNAEKDVDLFIAENNLSCIFELVICSENYTVGKYDNREIATRKDFEKVVNSTIWLDLQERNKILNEINILTQNFEYFRYKIPKLFFAKYVMIDDDLRGTVIDTKTCKLIVPEKYVPERICKINTFTEKYVEAIQKYFIKSNGLIG